MPEHVQPGSTMYIGRPVHKISLDQFGEMLFALEGRPITVGLLKELLENIGVVVVSESRQTTAASSR
jgi:hypothetical protein